MNINHLKYLVDAADLKSCSQAAKRNRISQPALSQSIRNLELELGYEILHHRPKSFELTQKGLALLVYARQILNLSEKAKFEVMEGKKEARPVRIICTHSFFKNYLKFFLSNLKQKNPAWNISVLFGDREKIKESLNEDLADIGFLLSYESLASFETRQLKKGYFYEISSSSSTLDSEAPLYVTSLKDKEVKRSLKGNTKLKSIVEIGSWESIYELVDSQLGKGIVPDYLIKNDKIRKKKLVEYNMLMVEKRAKKRPCAEFSSILFDELKLGINQKMS